MPSFGRGSHRRRLVIPGGALPRRATVRNMPKRLVLAFALLLASCAPAHPVRSVEPVRHAPTTTTTTTQPPATTVAPRPTVVQVSRSKALPSPVVVAPPVRNESTALASWYDPPWGGYTFASRTLAKGTRVAFSYRGRTVTATCEDYGPAAWTGRTFDLSRATFVALTGSTAAGVVSVAWTLA